MFVNGKSASSNAVPDLAGIRASFRAFQSINAERDQYQYLSGLVKYSEKQVRILSTCRTGHGIYIIVEKLKCFKLRYLF